MNTLMPLFWIGSSRDDLTAMPEDVCREIGFALFRAQQGKTYAHAKPIMPNRAISKSFLPEYFMA